MKIVNKLFLITWLLSITVQVMAVDQAKPEITLTSPVNNSTLSGQVVISADATDDDEVTKVIFYRDKWIELATVLEEPYSVTIRAGGLSAGSHQFFAVAYNSAGNVQASGVRIVNIKNAAPSPAPTPAPVPGDQVGYLEALRLADSILKVQDAGGAIKDSIGNDICNEDSTMEYALLGLAAAYAKTKNAKYLSGFEKGIAWLADREEMADAEWRGSWYYTFSCKPPYQHIATSPGGVVVDVRGVDTTSAYFPYLIYVHREITKSNAFVNKYAAHAKAALDFVIRKNLNSEGLTYSSFQLIDGVWELWTHQYSADQADVYLGFRAGAFLYDDANATYKGIADNLQEKIPALFFDAKSGRYAQGRDEAVLDFSEDFDGIFPQGYIPWVLGATPENNSSFNWLTKMVQADGSVLAHAGDPKFSLSISTYLIAANALNQPTQTKTINFLLQVNFDKATGGLYDSDRDKTEFSNVAAFAVLGLLKQSAFSW